MIFLGLLVVGAMASPATAQLIESPLPHEWSSGRSDDNLRTKSTEPVSLPFWDDFASGPGYADTLWINSNTVYISSGIGVDPPSINVATFDGLDSLGSPYNPNEPSATGFTDKLVSRPIKMSEVAPAERESVYLSFFCQWRGNGESPDDKDFFRVEFKNDQGAWTEIRTIFGDEFPDLTVFNSIVLQVSGDTYFHDDFQFRLRSYGRMSGPFDTWVIDYIYLNKGRNPDPPSFPDRAAASAMSSLFDRYYAVPLKHFFIDRKLDSVTFDVQNLRGSDFGGASINYRMNAKFYHYFGEDPPLIYGENLINSRGVKGESGVMLPNERVTIRLDTLPDTEDPVLFNPNADAIKIELKMKLISSDSIDPERPAFLPLDFRVNDTISASYILGGLYAYDDGIAEYSVGLTQPGNRLAYRFDMLSDTATLAGFEIYFPYLGGSNSQSLDLYIYGNQEGQPAQNPIYSILGRTITKNSKNEFMYIPLQPPVFIDDSIFYIGYREPVTAGVKVGLDKSNDTGDKMYVYVGSSWQQNSDVQGSLMIRPVFGGVADPITAVPEEARIREIFPNPNNGVFYISGQVWNLVITDIAGKDVPWTLEPAADEQKVTLLAPTPGMYIVRWLNSNGTCQRKVLVRN